VTGEDDRYSILTDIAGAEDHYGDMDFKVAGTREGITSLQMDIKVTNVGIPMMREALEQAKRARMHILDVMEKALSEPRKEVSQYAPRFLTLKIPTDKIRDLIGPGGKKIRSITESTGAKIDVMEDGTVHIYSTDATSGEAAYRMVSDVTAVPETGKTYLGKVVRLAEFGAFVELFPGTDGLLHISEVAEHRIKNVRDELKEGDQILVKVLSIEGNRIRLSRKAVLREQRDKQHGQQPQEAQPPAQS
jgi:polyribonucleotide nucleotidyltransferase